MDRVPEKPRLTWAFRRRARDLGRARRHQGCHLCRNCNDVAGPSELSSACQSVPFRVRNRWLERGRAGTGGHSKLSFELVGSGIDLFRPIALFEFASRGSRFRVPSSPRHTAERSHGQPKLATRRSSGSVDIGSVVDAHNIDRSFDFVQLVHDPVGAATSRPESGQFPLERVANLVGRFDQWSHHELDSCCGDFRRQPSEGVFSRSSDR